MFVPDSWGHLAPNRFFKYGFAYNCVAQWVLVQNAAEKFAPFEQYFSMSPEELPEIDDVTEEVLAEGVEAMLEERAHLEELPSGDDIPKVYITDNRLLGAGISRLRAEFGDTFSGKNMYGECIFRVLSRRGAGK